MQVVSNTSPISNLAIIGRLELLKARYGTVLIPPEVRLELDRLTHLQAKETIELALNQGWLVTTAKPGEPKDFSARFDLDIGELEANKLAFQLKADVPLMDEKRGRSVARDLGIAVAGILGELLHAKIKGLIPAVRPEFERLRREAGFFIHIELERFLLSQVGE